MALLLALVPAHRAFSLDAWRKPKLAATHTAAWHLWALRFQVAVVYVSAGLAKLTSDWLLHAQPLNIWLSARTETAVIGPWLDEVWVAYLFSWSGFLFDTTIVLWLSWRRSRPWAYIAVLLFHGLTHVFFNIGLFPFLMAVAATLFFSPSWPRRWLPGSISSRPATPMPPMSWAAGMVALLALIQLVMPLRHYLYPGNVLWNEDGMRWSWKVMVREKHGAVTYHVRFAKTGKELQISPRRYLDNRQEREMAGQPDLILQLAHHIAADYRGRGLGPVAVRAEAMVSLNGRPPAPLIDSSIDLATVTDGLGSRRWVLQEPLEPPIRLHARTGL